MKGLQEAGRRLFHREGPITLKDLDLTIFVLAQRIKRYRLSKERRGRRDVTEKRDLSKSRTEVLRRSTILRATGI